MLVLQLVICQFYASYKIFYAIISTENEKKKTIVIACPKLNDKIKNLWGVTDLDLDVCAVKDYLK